jgi:hypothetical protein
MRNSTSSGRAGASPLLDIASSISLRQRVDKQQNLHDFLFFISLKTTVGLRENNQQPIKWQEIYVVISQLLLFERKEREAEQTKTFGQLFIFLCFNVLCVFSTFFLSWWSPPQTCLPCSSPPVLTPTADIPPSHNEHSHYINSSSWRCEQ